MNFSVSDKGAGKSMISTMKYARIDANGTSKNCGRFFLKAIKRLPPVIRRIKKKISNVE